jgi:hypothetical protein
MDLSSSDQISTRWFPYERSDEISTSAKSDPMGAKKNQTSSWIEYGGDTDRISDVEEVLESGGIEVEKIGDLSIPMMAPSDLPASEEGGTDGIDAATLTSKSVP